MDRVLQNTVVKLPTLPAVIQFCGLRALWESCTLNILPPSPHHQVYLLLLTLPAISKATPISTEAIPQPFMSPRIME
jgi:hypothetical protein